MLRAALLVGAVAVVVLPGNALSERRGAADPAANARAQLRIVALRPLTVAGTGFREGESVRVTAITDAGAGSRSEDAGRTGRIGVQFPKLKLGRCSDYVVSARGDEGSRATVRSIPRPCGVDR